MRTEKIRLVLAALAMATAAEAGAGVALHVNTVSRHDGDCARACNEDNGGLGVEWRELSGRAVSAWTAGTLTNSVGDRSYYAGAVKAYRAGWGPAALEVGAFGGLVYYPSAERFRGYVPAVLPYVAAQLGQSRLQALYVPAVSDEVVGAWLFQVSVDM